ncbi:MAG: zinc-dependent metalloprotease [Bacteroidetes bacterium]|nr:zinc-dependent metalloprotease [Bacteroidota bacterium]
MKKQILLLIAAMAGSGLLTAQNKSKNNKKKPQPPAEAAKPKEDKPSIASKTKTCKKIPGLFTLYRDTVNGKLYMTVRKDQIGKEFIHFTYTENGVVEAGANRGQYRGSRIFTIKKYYEYIEFEQQNTGFYFNPKSELAKSAGANISHSSLAFEKILAADEKAGEYLLDADELFLSEKLHQIKPTPMPGIFGGMGFTLGSLSKNKTRYDAVRNYPENTDLVVKYVFDNPYPGNGGSNEVTDARAVSILVQHSLLQMPENDFKPRFDDPRVGYFSEEVNDMTTTQAVNYRDMIHRWHLVKKDPATAVSEPVKPITWWIENTTPKEYRETIKQAALAWNKAFEPLGYKNAVQIFEQPDTATWDAGDIRYNVLRWTSSPNPPFGGYGPSFVNPRTGEILGADIMLEYVFVTNRLVMEKLFEAKGSDAQSCEAGHALHLETLLGAEMLKATGASEVEMTKLIKQSLFYLILHEMGHTLGLMHNMKASQLHSPTELRSQDETGRTGLIGSVMDYPAINLNGITGGPLQYCQTQPGPYDLWAVEFGYSDAVADESAEAARLEKILSRSTEPALAFGNDADDMRSPGKAIDPRVMINDLSNDAITYGTERIEQVQSLMKTIKDRYGKDAASYQEMRNAWSVLSGNYSTMVGVISRYIGGVYVERAAAGQSGAKQPYTPVSKGDQKRAMAALAKYAFSPNAMEVPSDLIPYLQPQRRGFGFFGGGEDPKLHNRVESMQNSVLDHLLSPSVLLRLTDSREYGNDYSAGEMMGELTQAIFQSDLAGPVNTHRQILQTNYIDRLIAIAGLKSGSRYDKISRARATGQLLEIQKQLKLNPGADKETREHRSFLLQTIENGLKP